MRNVPLGSNFETAVWLVERLQDRVGAYARGNRSRGDQIGRIVVLIGEELHAAGGLQRMEDVFDIAVDLDRSAVRLDALWDGIGGWYA